MPVFDGRVWMVGSCNGLLCLRVEEYEGDEEYEGIEEYVNPITPHPFYLLWNPAFREFRQVTITFPYFEGDSHIGFGFSPIVNDYKIVKLYAKYDHGIYLVEVYSLGIGSWKQIEVGDIGGLRLRGGAGFTINGAIFWVGFKLDIGKGREYVMVSFDIAREEFALIPVPPVDLDLTSCVNVTELEHRLAILCSTKIGNEESCLIDLWVLEEGAGSWTNKYTSRPYPCLLYPTTIRRSEIACIFRQLPGDKDPIFFERTVLSNFTNTELKVLFDHRHYIFNYVDSLVQVSNLHIEES